MSITSKKEFFDELKKLTENNASDNVLDILEYANTIDSDTETIIKQKDETIKQLETEKTEIENMWREKYKNAFFNTPLEMQKDKKEENEDVSETIKINDLFKRKE